MFDALAEKLQATLARRAPARHADRGRRQRRDARDPPRAARGRRQLQGRREFTSAVKERALGDDVVGQLNPGQQVVKIVNEELTELMGGAGARPGVLAAPADGRSCMAGLQGSGKTTARPSSRATCASSTGSSSPSPPATSTGPPRSSSSSRSARRPAPTVYEQGTDARPGRDRRRGRASGPRRDGQGRADRRHRRPPARRRGADGRSWRDIKKAHQAARRAARRRRDDRPGRRQRRRAVRRGRAVRRRRHEQARRRRARRRRAVGQGGHRQADPVRLHRREARRSSSASTPTAWPSASSGWATC